MLMFLVRAECVKSLDSKYADYATEDICLLKVNVHQFDCFVLDMFDRFSDV